jgi:hypothetical protein
MNIGNESQTSGIEGEELRILVTLDGSKKEYEVSAKGKFTIALLATLGTLILGTAGYLLVTPNAKPALSQVSQEHSFHNLK